MRRYQIRVAPCMIAKWFINGEIHEKITEGLPDNTELVDILRDHNPPGFIEYIFVFEAKDVVTDIKMYGAEQVTPWYTKIET